MLCAHFLKDTSHENAPKLGLIRDICTGGNCETADGKLHERQWWGDEPAEPVCTTAVVIIQLWQSGP